MMTGTLDLRKPMQMMDGEVFNIFEILNHYTIFIFIFGISILVAFGDNEREFRNYV